MSAFFNEPVNSATLNNATFRLFFAGTDGLMDTTDDSEIMGATITYEQDANGAFMRFGANLNSGVYRIGVLPPIADRAGNVMPTEFTSLFSVAGPLCVVRPTDCADQDFDGIPNSLEAQLGLNAAQSDSRFDGVPDGARDFDGDGLSNAAEILLGINPARTDSDRDGLTDADERLRYGTNPGSPDTDNDDWTDWQELGAGTDPLNPASKPALRISLASAEVAVFNSAVEPPPILVPVFSGVAAFLNVEGSPATIPNFLATPLTTFDNQ